MKYLHKDALLNTTFYCFSLKCKAIKPSHGVVAEPLLSPIHRGKLETAQDSGRCNILY
jgi:hypothetical protein